MRQNCWELFANVMGPDFLKRSACNDTHDNLATVTNLLGVQQ